MSKSILITGGAGFIGSHVVQLFVSTYPEYRIVNLDALTYAGNLENLKSVENAPNYAFEKADIQDEKALAQIFEKHKITDVIHLAAESHVDRSISDPLGCFGTFWIYCSFRFIALASTSPSTPLLHPFRFVHLCLLSLSSANGFACAFRLLLSYWLPLYASNLCVH